MKDIKQIKFINEPSSFSSEDPTIQIVINEDKTTYQEFYKTQFDMFIKEEEISYPGPLWETHTHSLYFNELKDHIEEVFEININSMLDACSTIVTITYSDGSIKEKYIPGSFFQNDLDKVASLIRRIIFGIKIPPFLEKARGELKEEDI